MSVASRIKEARKSIFKYIKKTEKNKLIIIKRPATQKEFAKRLGFSRSYISALEKGIKSPSKRFLKALKYDFGISTDWILNGDLDQLDAFDDRTDTILNMLRYSYPPMPDHEIDCLIDAIKDLKEERRIIKEKRLQKEADMEKSNDF